MKRNVGLIERVARGAAAAGLLVCAGVAPVPVGLRIAGFAVVGVYLALTALAGRCVGYTLMGRSTCGIERRTDGERR